MGSKGIILVVGCQKCLVCRNCDPGRGVWGRGGRGMRLAPGPVLVSRFLVHGWKEGWKLGNEFWKSSEVSVGSQARDGGTG